LIARSYTLLGPSHQSSQAAGSGLGKSCGKRGEGNESERNAELLRKVVIDSFPTPSICRVGCRVDKLKPSPRQSASRDLSACRWRGLPGQAPCSCRSRERRGPTCCRSKTPRRCAPSLPVHQERKDRAEELCGHDLGLAVSEPSEVLGE
jgi:hypothetical protein